MICRAMSFAALAATLALGACGPAGEAAPSTQAPAEKVSLGQPIETGKTQVVVTAMEQRDVVGIQYAEERASDGATLVVIKFNVKNTGDKPVSMFEQPTLTLLDDKGVEYSSDIAKTSAFTMEGDVNTKVMSDLNPGITTQGVEVFEVAKDRFNPATWTAKVSGSKAAVALQ